MNGRAPDSFWDRLLRTLGAEEDEESDVDDSLVSFHLLFIVPILLVLVMLLKR